MSKEIQVLSEYLKGVTKMVKADYNEALTDIEGWFRDNLDFIPPKSVLDDAITDLAETSDWRNTGQYTSGDIVLAC